MHDIQLKLWIYDDHRLLYPGEIMKKSRRLYEKNDTTDSSDSDTDMSDYQYDKQNKSNTKDQDRSKNRLNQHQVDDNDDNYNDQNKDSKTDSSKQPTKRKRGRPRKNIEDNEKSEKPQKVEKKEKNDGNIILFLALSDEEPPKQSTNNEYNINGNKNIERNHHGHQHTRHSERAKLTELTENTENNDSGEDHFTVNDTETRNNIDSISEDDETTDSESDSNNTTILPAGFTNNKTLTVANLLKEIKKRDAIIARLQNRNSGMSTYANNKASNISYHCVQVADTKSGKKFVPKITECKCWWCNETFNNLPAYIVNYYANETYFVFGNFCSFNCSLKYNVKMLKDYKCNTRYALTNSLRIKVTGDPSPIKFAGDPESLIQKGGICTIEKFREGFSVISPSLRMNMPPLIPLIHVLEEFKNI